MGEGVGVGPGVVVGAGVELGVGVGVGVVPPEQLDPTYSSGSGSPSGSPVKPQFGSACGIAAAMSTARTWAGVAPGSSSFCSAAAPAT